VTPALLIVTATAAEREAAARSGPLSPRNRRGLDLRRGDIIGAGTVDFLVSGVGSANAAATSAIALVDGGYDLVISAGIAGGFTPTAVGETVVASAVVQADLGAEDGSGFLPVSQLGLGSERVELDPALPAELAARCHARLGAVLSVSTVTGTQATADARRSRCPDAVAEAMEGAGVLAAARVTDTAFAEVRTISNLVGPRDRSAWQIGPALDALGAAIAAITASALTRFLG
jgi:futalosine hydrolase